MVERLYKKGLVVGIIALLIGVSVTTSIGKIDTSYKFSAYGVDFDGDNITHYSDGLCPTESPYLTGEPLYIVEGAAWPVGAEDHLTIIVSNQQVHEYILEHLLV